VDGISRANSTAANTNTSGAFGIYRWGWGFSTNQDFNGDIALILCCGACWTGHMVRRWHADPFGFLRPWNEVPALIGSALPGTPPSSGTGVITFLMGSVEYRRTEARVARVEVVDPGTVCRAQCEKPNGDRGCAADSSWSTQFLLTDHPLERTWAMHRSTVARADSG
jgi:hypothetical protein